MNVLAVGGTMREYSTSLFALNYALSIAERCGATTNLIALRSMRLPIYLPETSLDDYGDINVANFVLSVRRANALFLSTGAYHGTIAGVTKNALDFLGYLSNDPIPNLRNKVVGLIATSRGGRASVTAVHAMIDVVLSLEGVVSPSYVAITQSEDVFDLNGNIKNEYWAGKLKSLVFETMELARKIS